MNEPVEIEGGKRAKGGCCQGVGVEHQTGKLSFYDESKVAK